MTSEPPDPKIQVGGDFKTGNISGQLAVGNGITQSQTIYKDCTFILPDGSTVQSKSWLYSHGIRPPTDPANIFGRLQELDKIDEIFKNNSALAITGFRQTGKSTLASMYLDIIEKRRGFAGICWRRMDETTDISDVVGSFFTVIGKPIQELGSYKVVDLLNLFFRELNAAPYFLVLDNFEILLDPQTNKPVKPGFSDLIEKIIDSGKSGKSRFLFTSWECPECEGGTRLEYYCIGGLDEQAALKLLRKLGLKESDSDLKRVIELSGGHPKALILLVQLVKEGEKLSSILDDSTLWKGEVAENILDKVYNGRLSEEERKLVQYVSLYRRPVPVKAMVFAANNPALTETVVKKMALKLKRKSLLQRTEIGDNYWEDSLIQDYAYSKLDDRVERHKFAHQYYLTMASEKPATVDVVQSLIEAHYHACMAKEYDTAASIIFDKNLDKDLDRQGKYRTLVELCTGVLPKDPLLDKPLLSDIKTHSAVLGNLGNAYRNLGQNKKAIQYYEKVLNIAQEIGDRGGEGTWLGNQGIAYYFLGQVEKAIQYYEKALAIVPEIRGRENEGLFLGGLGEAYRSIGQVEKAIQHFEKALAIAQEIGDPRNEGLWLGHLGLAYINLGQVDKAIQYYEKALAIAQEIGNRKNESRWLGNLGNAYWNLGWVEEAIQYYEEALAIAQEIGDRRSEGTWLGNLGNAYYYSLGQVKEAIQYYQKALAIAQEIGDRQMEGADLGNLGLAYHKLWQFEKAIEYLLKALAIAQEIGDRRSEGRWLGNLGIAYNFLHHDEKAIQYCEKALAIAQEIGDRKNESRWLDILGTSYSNLGVGFRYKKKYKEALACHLLAREIRTQIKDPDDLKTTESNLKDLKEELGEAEFEKLASEAAPRAEEIVKKILVRISGQDDIA